MFHSGTGPVPDTLRRLEENLKIAGLPYIIIGAIAMAAHQFRRATEDVDVCMRREDIEQFKKRFAGSTYQPVEGCNRRFVDTESNVSFDILIAGELAGRVSRNKEIRFPDPAEAVETEGIPTVTLPRLIELKLVTWRYKDWADVVELIRRNNLDEDFAQQLHPIIRMAYLQCYDQKVEEDRYEREA